MKVAAFTGFGGPDSVSIRNVDEPTPGAGEVIIDVEACALNHHELWIVEGDSTMISEDDLPFVSGLDVAGVVSKIGSGVESVESGDRVVLCPNETCGSCRYCRDGPENLCEDYGMYHGGLAEKALVRADRLIPLPDHVPATEAAAVPGAYMTVWHMFRRADVDAGDLVFVPGATGGVGVATVQLAEVVGARSIGTTTSPEKLDRLSEIGATHAIESDDPEEIREVVSEIGAVDVTINHLGGPYTAVGQDVLRRGGVMVVCGQTVGGVSEIELADLFLGHKRIMGSTMGTQADLETLIDLVDDGQFSPAIGGEYDLEETATALADMQNRSVFGKLVVRP